MKIDPNAPAHPSHGTMGEVAYTGLTIRAEFAARTMQGLLACPNVSGSGELLAKWAVEYADALIEALNKETP